VVVVVLLLVLLLLLVVLRLLLLLLLLVVLLLLVLHLLVINRLSHRGSWVHLHLHFLVLLVLLLVFVFVAAYWCVEQGQAAAAALDAPKDGLDDAQAGQDATVFLVRLLITELVEMLSSLFEIEIEGHVCVVLDRSHVVTAPDAERVETDANGH